MSTERLRAKLTKAGYDEDEVFDLDRSELLGTYAEYLLSPPIHESPEKAEGGVVPPTAGTSVEKLEMKRQELSLRKEELQMQREMRKQEEERRKQEFEFQKERQEKEDVRREEDLDRQRQRDELEMQRREEENQQRDTDLYEIW